MQDKTKIFTVLGLGTAFLAATILTVLFLLPPEKGEQEIHLTPEETLWLQRNRGKITIAPDPLWAPFEYLDENGMYSGIMADYLSLISQKISFNFRILKFADWKEILKRLRGGDVDMVTMGRTSRREKYLLFTPPLVSLKNVILVRSDFRGSLDMESMTGVKTGMPEGYAITEHVASRYPWIPLRLFVTTEEALRKLSVGEVQAVILDLPSASWYLRRENISTIRIAGEMDYQTELCFATVRDNVLLHSIISKAVRRITPAEKQFIRNKWVSLHYDPFYRDKRLKVIALSVTLSFLAIIIFTGLWNRTLRRRVDERTEELNRYKDHLEELVEQRTRELSRATDSVRKSEEEIQILRGLLPICSSCKKIRNDAGGWEQMESYIARNSEAEFSHGLCPECAEKLYGNQSWYKKMKEKG